MNRSKIEWCDHTLNIITGCRHGCPYCYAENMTHRFSGDVRQNRRKFSKFIKDGKDLFVLEEPFTDDNDKQIVYPFGFAPTYHKYRYENLDKLKMGCNIFVGAMADMFGEWVPDNWIAEVLKACEYRTQHNYLFLTKNPSRYIEFGVPDYLPNFWYGTSVTRTGEIDRIMDLPGYAHGFVSIEPLLEDLDNKELREALSYVDWVIIGAETGHRKEKIVPEFEWIRKIVLEADSLGKPIFMKDSLIQIIGEKNMRRDFPKELLEKRRSRKFADKMESTCMICKKKYDKHDMASITARVSRRGASKTIAAMCRACYVKWCATEQITSYEEELWQKKEKK